MTKEDFKKQYSDALVGLKSGDPVKSANARAALVAAKRRLAPEEITALDNDHAAKMDAQIKSPTPPAFNGARADGAASKPEAAQPKGEQRIIPAARDPRGPNPEDRADMMAEVRGSQIAGLKAMHNAQLQAVEADAFNRGVKGQKAVQERDKQAEEIQKAEARKNARFLSQRELAKYNNSVKWASEGMSADQIFRKHKSTTYTQPTNVPADVSNLPSTFLEDNNYTLTPPKGRSGEMPRLGEGLTPADQWNKLFPNRDVPAAAPALVRQPPGAQAMQTVVPEWNPLPNEHPDDLRARRADLIRQQLGIDTAPGWHLPQAPGSTDLLGAKVVSNADGTQKQVISPFGVVTATNLPALPGMMPPPVNDVALPPLNPDGKSFPPLNDPSEGRLHDANEIRSFATSGTALPPLSI